MEQDAAKDEMDGIENVVSGGISYWLYKSDRGSLPKRVRAGEIYESKLISLFEKKVRAGDTVIDVGANFGYFTVRLSKLVGPAGRVIALEPDPMNLAILEKNLAENNCKNVTVIGKAASDKVGETTLFLNNGSYASHSLAQDNVIKPGGGMQVEMTTLDALAGELDLNVNFVKTDAQGAEGRILAGAQEILARPDIMLALEFWPHGLRSMGTDPIDLLVTLRAAGLQLGLLSMKRGVRPATDGEISEKLVEREYSRYSSSNVIAWRGRDVGKHRADPTRVKDE